MTEPDSLSLRPAEAGDSETVFAWQHEPGVRRYFHNPNPPTRDEHDAWFAFKLADPDGLALIAQAGREALGFLRLDRDDQESVIVSILLSQAARGQGLAARLLSMTVDWVPFATILADVHLDNGASLAAFRKARFSVTSEPESTGPFLRLSCPPKHKPPGSALFVDSGASVGAGHLTRSATLARALRVRGCATHLFLPEKVDKGPSPLTSGLDLTIVGEAFFKPRLLSTGATNSVIDSYRLEPSSRPDHRAAVFDDLLRWPDGPGLIRVSIGQPNAGKGRLSGPEWQILRDDLPLNAGRQPEQVPKRLLVTIGAGDPLNLAQPLVNLLSELTPKRDLTITYVTGAFVDMPEPRPGVTVLPAQPTLTPLMEQSDMALVAGGQTLIECLACGLPTAALLLADNQREQLDYLDRLGACLKVADARNPGWEAATTAQLRNLLEDARLRSALVRTGSALYDGKGAERIAAVLSERVQV